MTVLTSKVYSLDTIEEYVEIQRKKGLKVVHCHGVFDLIHPGHIRHFKAAKTLGDILIVSITPDKYVNKGPGRPAFSEELRIESLEALECIDCVVLNSEPDSVNLISKIKPDFYVKGDEYKEYEKDVTGKIEQEVNAVERYGGQVHYTSDIVYSSSSLINTFFPRLSSKARKFIQKLKQSYTSDDIIEVIHNFRHLNVLVIGDAIIDEYQYVTPLGQSGKGVHMTSRLGEREVFLGGAFAIANHIAAFTDNVTLLTTSNQNDSKYLFNKLNKKINRHFIDLDEIPTLIKKRYIFRDGSQLTKLFETYSQQDCKLNDVQTKNICDYLKSSSKEFDLVLVADFGHGLTNETIQKAVSQVDAYLAVNAQINSGNRGYNVVTKYDRADFISVNEPELRLTAHDRVSNVEELMEKIGCEMHVRHFSVTCGVEGVISYEQGSGFCRLPAFASQTLDRVGAGDSYLSLASLALASGSNVELASFIGSIAAAMDVQFVGNKETIQKAPLCKYITALMK